MSVLIATIAVWGAAWLGNFQLQVGDDIELCAPKVHTSISIQDAYIANPAVNQLIEVDCIIAILLRVATQQDAFVKEPFVLAIQLMNVSCLLESLPQTWHDMLMVGRAAGCP